MPEPRKWSPTPHALLPLPSEEIIRAALADPARAEQVERMLLARERQIEIDATDPYHSQLEPDVWAKVDSILADPEVTVLALFGGNRTGKSFYCAKRVARDSCDMAHPETLVLCASETEPASIITVQSAIWRFLPANFRALNGKRSRQFTINYSVAGGFTAGPHHKIVLPTRSQVYFGTYNQDAKTYEGIEFGNRGARRIGAWLDESAPLSWLEMVSRRGRFRNAIVLWAFTPINGMTPAIKEFMGSAWKLVESAPAELLPAAQAPGCPRGHMPLVVVPWYPKSRAVYFHVGSNPFGNYTQEVKNLCAGKTTEYIERIAYGYARDTVMRAFPTFGPQNVVPVEKLPRVGTRYQVVDPGAGKMWSAIWVLVTDENPPRFYIYRDFPAAAEFGEWAVASQKDLNADTKRGWGGDPGPAQLSLGWDAARYRREFRKLEGGERVAMRLIDPRAFEAPSLEGRRLSDVLGDDAPENPGMEFAPAPGLREEHGVQVLETLLAWNTEEPMVWPTNMPRLFVTENCRQVIWALSNYTRMSFGDSRSASRDYIDLLRYMATADLWHDGAEGLWREDGRRGGY